MSTPNTLLELKKLIAASVPLMKGEFDAEIAKLEKLKAEAEALGTMEAREKEIAAKEEAIKEMVEKDTVTLQNMLQTEERIKKQREALATDSQKFDNEQAKKKAELVAMQDKLNAMATRLAEDRAAFEKQSAQAYSEITKAENAVAVREKAVADRETRLKQAASAL